jgi:type IV pilus assembly protein PilM
MPSSGSILGIDLRVTSVKVVEIEKGKERTVLKNWGMTEVPYSLVDKHPQKEDAQAQALRKLVQTRKIKTREASVVVGGGDVYVKIFTLSEMAGAETAEAIKWKFAEEIPFPVEEALIDFYSLPKREPLAETRDYVAACINLKTFREIEYIIRRAGLRLVSISVMSDSLEKAFQSRVLEEKNKIVSLIYMGKRTTNISIFKDGNLEFNRELNIGGENITLAMSGVLVSAEGRVEISPDEAEKIKVEHGIPVEVEKYPKLEEIPITQLQAMVRPALERVQDEIMRTFEYYKGQTGEAAIHKIYLTGGSAMTINLVDFLSEGLGTPVLVLDAMEGRVYSEKLPDKPALEKVLSRLSAAIGAALLAGEKINLMPEEVKHHFRVLVQKYSRPQYLVPAFVVALLLFYGVFWLQAYNLNQELNSIQKKLEQYKPRIASLNVLEKTAIAEEKKRLEFMAGREKGTKMPLVFEEISRLIPRSVFINSLNLTPSELHMWGTAFEIGDTAENILSRFVLALSASEFFGDVKLIQAVKNYEYLQDAFNFEIVAKMTI